jgi:hypothetical protein
MSRDSMLLLAGGSVIIACMVIYYDNQHIGVKGLGKGKPVAIAMKNSVTDETDNIEQTGNDNNSIDQIAIAVGKSGKGAKRAPQKPQINKEQFVAFDAWPTASNNCPNKPEELPTQDTNQEPQSANTDQIASGASTPQSVLDDELKSTSQLYQGLANQLDKQSINVTEYNAHIRGLQREYNEKIKTLFQKKQKLDATQKLIDNGVITPEEGKKVMWQLVLPNETIRAISAKPKAPDKQPSVSKPVYGTVTGISYSNEDPLVMIDGEIYHEGASVHGVRIAKIYQQSVDFEYKGLTWNQGVNDQPSPNWP